VLERWSVTIVAAAPDQVRLRDELAASPDWRRAYEDVDGAIFVRANRERRLAADAAAPPGTGPHFWRDPASPILYRR
jgi:hypothetical protein